MERLRLFIAIELPPAVHQLISTLQEQIAPATRDVRWVAVGNSHITLKFLGPTEAVMTIQHELASIGARLAPLTLATAQAGVFPNRQRPRVFWLGLTGELARLDTVQQAVEVAIAPLGFPTEQRRFTPHITLGRIKPPPHSTDWPTLLETANRSVAALPNQHWQVHDLVLMQSDLGPDGARYTPIQRVALTGA